jgi:lipoprotein-releasing system permease protein
MAFGAFERMVAFRYLRARRQEGFVSVIAIFSLLGIALGVATLIVVMAVMNGFRVEFISNIIGINGYLRVTGATGTIANFDDLDAKIRQISGITAVRPLVEGQVLASTPKTSTGALVRGLRAEDIASQPLLANGIAKEALDQLSDDGVILGWRLLDKLGLQVGGNLTLLVPESGDAGSNAVPRARSFHIVGTVNVGMSQYDGILVLMPLDTAQTFFRTGDGVPALEIFASDPDRLDAQRRAIAAIVGPGTRVLDWRQNYAGYLDIIAIQRNVMFLILTLIIVVAAFNIIAGLIMLVKSKGRDIAILRTMGATQAVVLRIFMLSGASIGFVGTFAGFVIGVEFAVHIEAIRHLLQGIFHVDLFNPEQYFLTEIPARIYASDVISVVSMAFALSLLATIYPAWRASRLDPVQALRYA